MSGTRAWSTLLTIGALGVLSACSECEWVDIEIYGKGVVKLDGEVICTGQGEVWDGPCAVEVVKWGPPPTITAEPAEEGQHFIGWSGVCADEGSSPDCSIGSDDAERTNWTAAHFERPVDCDHPGAGDPVEGGCDCLPNQYSVLGRDEALRPQWQERYQCDSGGCQPEEDVDLNFFPFEGRIRASMSLVAEPWVAEGDLCDDVFVWTTEPAEELGYYEEGTWVFLSDTRFEKYSEYWIGEEKAGEPDAFCVGIGDRSRDDLPSLDELTVVEPLDCGP